jgi:hypothetical protein
MRYPVPLLSSPPFHSSCPRMGTQARWVPTWQRARGVLCEILVEAGWYACGSPRSRLHQRAVLRELDERLLRDIGVDWDPELAGRPHHRFDGYR